MELVEHWDLLQAMFKVGQVFWGGEGRWRCDKERKGRTRKTWQQLCSMLPVQPFPGCMHAAATQMNGRAHDLLVLGPAVGLR